MKLIQVDITNFRSIENVSVPLDSPGLHLILGQNKDNPAFDSNGSGKSSVFEAVIWGLFGEFLRPQEVIDNVVRKGTKNCSVDLIVDPEDGSGPALITRTRSAKKSTLEVVNMADGSPMFPSGNISAKQEELNSWLGTDFTTFTNSVYFGKGLAKFFMLSNDNDRKELLESILKIVSFDKPLEAAKTALAAANSRISEMDANIVRSRAIVEQQELFYAERKKELDELVAKTDEIKTNNTVEVTKLINQKALIQMDIDVFEESRSLHKRTLENVATEVRQTRNIGDYSIKEQTKVKTDALEAEAAASRAAIESQYEQDKLDIQSQIDEISPIIEEQQQELREQEAALFVCTGELHSIVSSLNSFKALSEKPQCPTCLSNISSEHASGIIADLTARYESINSRHKNTTEIVESLRHTVLDPLLKELKSLEQQLTVLSNDRGTKLALLSATLVKKRAEIAEETTQAIRKLTDTCAKLERQKSNEANEALQSLVLLLSEKNSEISAISTRIKVLEDELVALTLETNRVRNALTSSNSTLESHKTTVEKLVKEREALLAEVPMLEFCVEAFGSKGIRSFIFENSLPFITERANYYSTYLTGGTIQIEISPTTTTKTTGNVKEKIAVTATNSIGSEVYGSNSDGERRRIDVCIILALQDLIASRASKPWKLMIFDEIVDALDQTGIQNLLDMLRSISTDVAVYIISHSSDLKQYFDETILIVKEGGISRLGTC